MSHSRLLLKSPLLIYMKDYFSIKKLFTLADFGWRPWCIRSTPLLGTKIFPMSWEFLGQICQNRSSVPSSCYAPLTESPGSAPGLFYPVADLGFPRFPPLLNLVTFSSKLHEIEKHWTERGRVFLVAFALYRPMLFSVCLNNEPSSMFHYGSEWCGVIGITSCGISEPWPRMVS